MSKPLTFCCKPIVLVKFWRHR